MIRRLGSLLVALLLTLSASTSLASPADDAKAALAKARESLLAMLDATEPAKLDALQAEIASASKAVDGAVTGALADKATAADKAVTYKELKKTWEEFKKTRDKEIIPAIRAGKKDDAKALAKGVQAERFKKMGELLASLGAK